MVERAQPFSTSLLKVNICINIGDIRRVETSVVVLGISINNGNVQVFSSVASMKLSWDDEKEMRDFNAPKSVYPHGVAAMEGVENSPNDVEMVEQLGLKNDTQNVYCCNKTDERGWQCQKKAKDGEALCEHHSSLVNNYKVENSAVVLGILVNYENVQVFPQG